MSTKQIFITPDEQEYLGANLRALEKSPKLGESQKDLAQNLLVEVEMGAIIAVRVKARFLQGVVKMSLTALKDVVQPGYKRRMTSPQTIKKYQPYVDKNNAKIEMLEGLLEKIEGAL